MALVKGTEVRPARWVDVLDLYDDGGYSAIWGRFDGNEFRQLGVRWNGEDGAPGYPNQGGNPLWYAEPGFLIQPILLRLLETLKDRNRNILRRDEYIGNVNIALGEHTEE